MSLILDALRKSDRQRNRRPAEQLRWGPGPASGSRPRTGNIVLLLVATGLTVAASAWLGSWLAARQGAAVRIPQIMENERSGEDRLADSARPDIRALSGELAATPDAGTSSAQSGPADASSTRNRQEAATTDAAAGDILAAPSLAEMPAEFRDRLPALAVNVHAWTEDPAQRFVLINMRRYAEGDRLEEGPVLRQITPDGVVLQYGNELFSLPQR